MIVRTAGQLLTTLDAQPRAILPAQRRDRLGQSDRVGNLAFQLEPDHEPPVWPGGAGQQQMQVHLDIGVTELETSTADAVALGARLAEHQPQGDVRVLLDPAGHLFCLYLDTD